jgi:hypothetical protein
MAMKITSHPPLSQAILVSNCWSSQAVKLSMTIPSLTMGRDDGWSDFTVWLTFGINNN